MTGIIPFIEPRVSIEDINDIEDFDKIASRLRLNGYVLLNVKYKEKLKIIGKNKYSLDHITRFELIENSVEKVKSTLPKIRRQYELVSIQTTSSKVAQWIVKDNRVDILTVPMKSTKEIITQSLANVAASNETFIEIDLSSLIFEHKKNKSVYLRQLSRILNILIREKTPFIITCNVNTPFMFRSKRAIQSFARVIGIPDLIFKMNVKKFQTRIDLNQKKLADEIVAPGIWKVNKESKKKTRKTKITNEHKDEFDIINSWKIDNLKDKQLERQRYFLFEIIIKKDIKITEKEFIDQFWKTHTEFFGILNSSKSGVFVSKFDDEVKLGILRCSHKTTDFVRTTLTLITRIEKTDVLIHVLRVSGTMKNLLETVKMKKSKN